MNHYKKSCPQWSVFQMSKIPEIAFFWFVNIKLDRRPHTHQMNQERDIETAVHCDMCTGMFELHLLGGEKIPFMLPWNLLKEKFVVLACKDFKNWLHYFSCKVVIFWTENQTFSPRNSVYRFQNVLLWPRCFWIYSFLFQGKGLFFWGGFQA